MAPVTSLLTSALLALPALALPAALQARAVACPKPTTGNGQYGWSIRRTNAFVPSDKQGTATLDVTIQDLNFVDPFEVESNPPYKVSFLPTWAECSLKWKVDEIPWGKPFKCWSSEHLTTWTASLVEYPEATTEAPTKVPERFAVKFEQLHSWKVEEGRVFSMKSQATLRVDVDKEYYGVKVASAADGVSAKQSDGGTIVISQSSPVCDFPEVQV